MRTIELYRKVKNYIELNLPFLGVNKRREIERLIFEILKIKKSDDFSQLPEYKNYNQFKKELIKQRYPYSYKDYPLKSFFLGKLELSEDLIWKDEDFKEVEVIVERGSNFERILKGLEKRYRIRSVKVIDSIKDCIKESAGFNYNERKRKIYLISERYDFIKPCPCTSNCISCGYIIVNLGFGCPFDCEYCYLSGYQNIDGIVINTNIEDYLKRILELKPKRRIRIGNGEFTDSLVYDDITSYSRMIINALRNQENIIFEFKTKSANISNILNEKPTPNVVISYSINPPKIAKLFEHGACDYTVRINSLISLVRYGWKVALHFDPMIYIDGWEEMYRQCIDDIFCLLPAESISWISIGTLRFFPHTKKAIESRFPDSRLLDSEMVIEFDGKLRYPFMIRRLMYSFLIERIKKYHFPVERIYLCMESKTMWDEIGIKPYFEW